jgi:hypothetical protein
MSYDSWAAASPAPPPNPQGTADRWTTPTHAAPPGADPWTTPVRASAPSHLPPAPPRRADSWAPPVGGPSSAPAAASGPGSWSAPDAATRPGGWSSGGPGAPPYAAGPVPPPGAVGATDEDDESDHPIRTLGSALLFTAFAVFVQTTYWADLVGAAGEGRNRVRRGSGVVRLVGSIPPTALTITAAAIAALLVLVALLDHRKRRRAAAERR